jgi:hypothetical protein
LHNAVWRLQRCPRAPDTRRSHPCGAAHPSPLLRV